MKKLKSNCLLCGCETSRKTYKFCSQDHDVKYRLMQREKDFDEGKLTSSKVIKRILLSRHGNKCYICNNETWNEKPIPLEVEHIDGNSENGKPENVSLICPNCHAQTDTYKGKNKGNGRHFRRIRYKEGKSY